MDANFWIQHGIEFPYDIEPPTEEEYRRAEIATYRRFAPRVCPCGLCGWPVPKGYVCDTCGHDGSFDDSRG
jgi:hypothetical protein